MLAGAELLLIPLPLDSMGLILHIGIGGVSGILIGAVLIVAGLLLWFHPVQRMFYSIVAVLLAISALIASNLGGFLIGTILGIVGGPLGFAWTPLPPGAAPRGLWRRGPRTPADIANSPMAPAGEEMPGVGQAFTGADTDVKQTARDGDDAAPTTVPAVAPADSDWGRLDPSWGAAGPTVSRYSRIAPDYRTRPWRGTVIGGNILTALIGLLTLGLSHLIPPSQTPATNPPAAAASPTPSASPSASPSTHPTNSAAPGASSTPTASPSPSPTPTGSAPPSAIAAAQSRLTASSASLTGFQYDGVMSVPTATGPVQMMQFSASSLDLIGVSLAVSQGGATMTTTASSLDFSGNVTLYATELSGDLLGIPTTLTPGNALSTILQLLGQLGLTQSLTQAIPLTMTNVTTLQPYTAADGLTASGLQIS
jgi:hypothetical protein